MRIAVVNWSRRKIGGTESYLASIIPELRRTGQQLAFWHEVDVPASNDPIPLPDGMPSWCVSALGPEKALAALREWRPDVIYVHSLMRPELEAEMLKVAPAVFFAHAYYGTCISGSKTFKRPTPTPCHRRFGWQCLVNYYPRRCGGLSPFTMLKEYERQSKRLEHLSIYRAIVTHSTYMRDEYINHGFDPGHVHCLSYYADEVKKNLVSLSSKNPLISLPEPVAAAEPVQAHGDTRACWRLLFLGRMDFLKGGLVFIDALPQVSAALDRPLRVTFAGDGPDRKDWERRAARAQAQSHALDIEFVGWVKDKQREAIWSDCDLLVLPSVWPEPFGLVGPEAGLRGVPTVAFAVGGITDWLRDGINGYAAPGDPPSANNLAEAILKCLRDPTEYERLRRGALMVSQQFNLEGHLISLLSVLEKVGRGH